MTEISNEELQCLEQGFAHLYLDTKTQEFFVKSYQPLESADLHVMRFQNFYSIHECLTRIQEMSSTPTDLPCGVLEAIQINYPELLI